MLEESNSLVQKNGPEAMRKPQCLRSYVFQLEDTMILYKKSVECSC